MGVLLDRAGGAAEGIGRLLLGPVGQVAQDHHLPLPAGQAPQQLDEVHAQGGVAGLDRRAHPDPGPTGPSASGPGPGLWPPGPPRARDTPRPATNGRRPGPGLPGPPPRRPRPSRGSGRPPGGPARRGPRTPRRTRSSQPLQRVRGLGGCTGDVVRSPGVPLGWLADMGSLIKKRRKRMRKKKHKKMLKRTRWQRHSGQ